MVIEHQKCEVIVYKWDSSENDGDDRFVAWLAVFFRLRLKEKCWVIFGQNRVKKFEINRKLGLGVK